MYEVTLQDVLTMLTIFVTILLLMVCCTCYMKVERDKNDLFYKPKVIDFRRRRRCVSPIGYKVYTVDVPEVSQKKYREDLVYLEYPIV